MKTPSHKDIEERALETRMKKQSAYEVFVSPEPYELKEDGGILEARTSLMSDEGKNQALKYVNELASELGLSVVSQKENKENVKVSLKEAKKNYIKFEENLDSFLKTHSPPFFVETKFDGEWVLIVWTENSKIIFNRHKSVYYPEGTKLGESLEKALKQWCWIVAEFVSGKDVYDFLSARTDLNNPELKLMVHDLLWVNGLYLQDFSLQQRKEMLENLIIENEQTVKIKYEIVDFGESVFVNGDRKESLEDNVGANLTSILPNNNRKSVQNQIMEIFEKTIKEGHEGIVVKPLDSKYEDHAWLKMKREETGDYVILGINKTKKFSEGGLAYSFLIGKYEDGKYVPKSKVGSGLKLEEKDLIKRFIPALKTSEDDEFVYLQPFFVVTVIYETHNQNALRSPHIERLRSDKSPEDCI